MEAPVRMSSEEQVELARKVSRLAEKAWGFPEGDLWSTAWFGAHRAAQAFDPDRGSERSLLTRAAWNACADFARKDRRSIADEVLAAEPAVEDPGPSMADLLAELMDAAGVRDPEDRRAALAAWAGRPYTRLNKKRVARVRAALSRLVKNG